ncbi:MAG TPA: outer membrane beta-barrel protein [Verrucomicrobiae bacterium]|nr:outer membrane beta-barrel protein [Verrucomicrobiae bacterium]
MPSFFFDPFRARKGARAERLAISRRSGARLLGGGGLLLLTIHPGVSQDALRYSLAGQAAMEAHRLQPDAMPYTVKSGDFKLLMAPTAALEWNDNVNLVRDHAQQDFVFRPVLNLSMSYPLTDRNLLLLNLGAGYQQYFQHNELSTWYLASGSMLSFDMAVKDVLINFHDQFSYSRDAALEAAVAETSQFGNIFNDAGVRGTWDLNDLTLSLGYDHINFASPAAQFSSQDRATESLSSQAGLKFSPRITAGLEATAALTSYDKLVLNDNTSYSAGIYADWRPGSFLRIQPRIGYTITQFQHTSQSIQTADVNSWYADLTVNHAITDAITYSLSAGHEIRTGIGSDTIEDWYARPSVDWNIVQHLTLRTALTCEHGSTGTGNVQGNLMEVYDYAGFDITLGHEFTSRLYLALNFRVTIRGSSLPARQYEQNLASLQLTYTLK